MFKRFLALMSVAGVALFGAAALGASPALAASSGTVYVVHGIPGVAVDVYVNGTKTLTNFTPTTVAGPLTLPAATYDIKVFAAGANPASTTPVITASVALPAGANASLVAHLDASGKPVLTTFVNDVSAAAAGKGRLIVRHTAAAPAVDILANGSAAFTNVTNGQEGKVDLPAGTISASVVATGTTTPALIGPANVTVPAGMATVVYAIGAPAAGGTASTLGVVTQQIPLAGASMLVPTGTGGLLERSGTPMWAAAGFALALAVLVLSGRALVRSRV